MKSFIRDSYEIFFTLLFEYTPLKLIVYFTGLPACSVYNFVCVVFFHCCRLTEERGGCYTSIGLPLIANTSILEQPLDLWTLTEKYQSAATRIIKNARCNTAAKESIVSTGCNNKAAGRNARLLLVYNGSLEDIRQYNLPHFSLAGSEGSPISFT